MTGRHASHVTEPVRILGADEIAGVLHESPTDAECEVEAGISVLSGTPDAEELAAITAVLAGVLDELAAEQGRRQLNGPSAWDRSRRGLRAPLTPGHGQWRSFSA